MLIRLTWCAWVRKIENSILKHSWSKLWNGWHLICIVANFFLKLVLTYLQHSDNSLMSFHLYLADLILLLSLLHWTNTSITDTDTVPCKCKLTVPRRSNFETRSSKLSSAEVRVECIEYRVERFEFRDKKQRTFCVISFSHVLSENPVSFCFAVTTLACMCYCVTKFPCSSSLFLFKHLLCTIQ